MSIASRTPRTIAALVTMLAPGCAGEDEHVEALADVCIGHHGKGSIETPAQAGIRLDVTSGRTVGPPATDITVRGVAEHVHELAIHGLAVAGIAARSEDFNFGQWSAVIPLSLLSTLPRDAATGEVLLALVVRDSCGSYEDPEPLRVTIDAAALTIDEVAYAEPAARYVPVDATGAATVTIHAARGAAGARVRVIRQPAEGLHLDGVSGGYVTLQAVDEQARAVVRVTATEPGTYTLIASSLTSNSNISITAAGPPSYVPGSVTLTPGTTRNVAVLSDGDLLECWAVDVPDGVSITLDGADLAKAPASQAGSTKAWTLTIAADMALTGDHAATVVCRDYYRQSARLDLAIDG